jgi:hypothetical protein
VDANGDRTVEITAAGPMQFFRATETNLALQENKRSDEVITELVKEVVIPPPLSKAWVLGRSGFTLGQTTRLANTKIATVFNQGKTTFVRVADNWVRRGDSPDGARNNFDVYRAIRDVVGAERGRFLFSRDSTALFWNRHYCMLPGAEETPKATFSTNLTGLSYSYASLEHLKNEIIVTCNPRAISATSSEVLWQLPQEVRIPAGQQRTVIARFQDSAGNRIAARNVSLSSVVFSKGFAYVSFTAKANSAEIVLGNPGKVTGDTQRKETEDAILTNCVVLGQKITDLGRVDATSIDNGSIADHGRRTLRLNLPAVDNLDDAQSIAIFERVRRSQPRGIAQTITLCSHGKQGGGQHADQLNLTLGDLITVQETQTGHSADYFIIGEMHRLAQGATLFETTWYLETAPKTYPWKLDHNTRSRLDNTTRLTY